MASPAPARSQFSAVLGFRAEQIAVSRHLLSGHVGLRSADSPLAAGAARRLMPHHAVRTVTELHHYTRLPFGPTRLRPVFPQRLSGRPSSARPKTEAGKSPSSSQPSRKAPRLPPEARPLASPAPPAQPVGP
jgi:hypothetical protein